MNALALQTRAAWGHEENTIPEDVPMWAHVDRVTLCKLIAMDRFGGIGRHQAKGQVVFPMPAESGYSVEFRPGSLQGYTSHTGAFVCMEACRNAIASITVPSDMRKPAKGTPLWDYLRDKRPEKVGGRIRYVPMALYQPGGDLQWRPVKLDASFNVEDFEPRPAEVIPAEPPKEEPMEKLQEGQPSKKVKQVNWRPINDQWLAEAKAHARAQGMDFSSYIVHAINFTRNFERMMNGNTVDECAKWGRVAGGLYRDFLENQREEPAIKIIRKVVKK